MSIRGMTALGTIMLAAVVLPAPGRAQGAEPARTWSTQRSEGVVTLEATPSWQSGALVVALSANTHSVDLSSVDLVKAATLYVDEVAYAAEKAGSLGGHHAKASVTFPLAEMPRAFRLEIRGVPDVDLRVLAWPTLDTPAALRLEVAPMPEVKPLRRTGGR